MTMKVSICFAILFVLVAGAFSERTFMLVRDKDGIVTGVRMEFSVPRAAEEEVIRWRGVLQYSTGNDTLRGKYLREAE
jgi:hypothetical protein